MIKHMAARQIEEALDIGNEFAAAIAFPRQPAMKAELAAKADGDDGTHVMWFASEPPVALLASQARHVKAVSQYNGGAAVRRRAALLLIYKRPPPLRRRIDPVRRCRR